MQHNQGPDGRDGRIREFVRRGFTPHFGEKPAASRTDPRLKRLAELGTEPWLDSGDAEAIGRLWTDAFFAVTTNNTLLNKEVQKGTYDDFIKDAAALLNEFPELTANERMLELAFMLNARHGLTLVEQFDAYVSVEEHTALAHDCEGAVSYARRFHAVCPERFIVKMPFTAAGVLATRRAAADGIPVNHTLGFSARQNYLIASIAKPAFLNVFLGRLNSVVADNELGSGDLVGERATLASQAIIRRLRNEQGLPTRQIAASLRNADQIVNLAGVDVMTIPIAVAEAFMAGESSVDSIASRVSEDYAPGIDSDAAWARFDTLWDIPNELIGCIGRLAGEDLDTFTPDDLVEYLAVSACGDVLVRWSPFQVSLSAAEGKIPILENWREMLEEKRIGLDSLMNLAGLNAFTQDQADMDRHVAAVLGKEDDQ